MIIEKFPQGYRERFDKGLVGGGMALISRQEVPRPGKWPTISGLLFKALVRNHPERWFTLSYQMPTQYPPDVLANAPLTQLSALYGINWRPIIDSAETAQVAAQGNADFHRNRHIIDAQEASLQKILRHEKQEILPIDPVSERAVSFLGMESIEEFDNNIEGYFQDFMADYVNSLSIDDKEGTLSSVKKRLHHAMEFSKEAYNLRDKPTRDTGEPYYFHTLRVSWYLLTYLKRNDMLPEDPQQLVSLVETALFHDIYEDLKATEEDPRNGKGKAYFAEGLHDGERKEYLVVEKPNGSRMPYQLDPYQKDVLLALDSHDDRTYLQQSMKEDDTGWAALIKMMDRTDNLLTSRPNSTNHKLLCKIIESFTSMGEIALHAQSGKDWRKRNDLKVRALKGKNVADMFPLSVLTYGMFLLMAENIWPKLLKELQDNGTQMTANMKGIYFKNLQERIPLSNLVKKYQARLQSGYNYDSSAAADLFGYDDICVYLQDVAEACIYERPISLF